MAEAPQAGPVPSDPARTGGPSQDWKHRELYDRVIKALYALPWEFETDINIAGVPVTDLFTFNSALGAAIEKSVVQNLNKLRPVWDPDDQYRQYRFVRQAQNFPDVLLQAGDPTAAEPILMGIELKGWFATAKEGEPSFRYVVTPEACAPQDLLVVFPWILQEVISGRPMLLRPFVEEARYAAQIRNYYWEIARKTKGTVSNVILSSATSPYPLKSTEFNDRAANDGGKNFGRVSRSGITGNWIKDLMQEPVSGIPLGAWQNFVRIFSEGKGAEQIEQQILALRKRFPLGSTSSQAESIHAILEAVESLVEPSSP